MDIRKHKILKMNITFVFTVYMLNYVYMKFKMNSLYPNMTNINNISKLVNSCINVSVSIVFCLLYLVSYDMSYVFVLRNLSVGFYLYDLVLVTKLRQYVFIVHHLLTIYSMDKWLPNHVGDSEGNLLVMKYLILETGNLFIYRVSYKKYISVNITLNDLMFEFYNMIVRIIVAIYCMCVVKDTEKLYVLVMLLSGALLWTKKLIIQITTDMRRINTI